LEDLGLEGRKINWMGDIDWFNEVQEGDQCWLMRAQKLTFGFNKIFAISSLAKQPLVS
jgi:hypothetical protein